MSRCSLYGYKTSKPFSEPWLDSEGVEDIAGICKCAVASLWRCRFIPLSTSSCLFFVSLCLIICESGRNGKSYSNTRPVVPSSQGNFEKDTMQTMQTMQMPKSFGYHLGSPRYT